MEKKINQGEQEILRDKINLVIARLDVSSPNLYFSSGSNKETYSRDDMIEHVRNCDEVGKSFIAEQLEFLRAFKDGSLVNLIAQNL